MNSLADGRCKRKRDKEAPKKMLVVIIHKGSFIYLAQSSQGGT